MQYGEEYIISAAGRPPSIYAWCELVFFTIVEQSANTIMEGMYPMVSVREAEP